MLITDPSKLNPHWRFDHWLEAAPPYGRLVDDRWYDEPLMAAVVVLDELDETLISSNVARSIIVTASTSALDRFALHAIPGYPKAHVIVAPRLVIELLGWYRDGEDTWAVSPRVALPAEGEDLENSVAGDWARWLTVGAILAMSRTAEEDVWVGENGNLESGRFDDFHIYDILEDLPELAVWWIEALVAHAQSEAISPMALLNTLGVLIEGATSDPSSTDASMGGLIEVACDLLQAPGSEVG